MSQVEAPAGVRTPPVCQTEIGRMETGLSDHVQIRL